MTRARATFAFLQDLPGIPEGVKSEGTVAVLFMVLVGFAALGMILKWGPGLLIAWRAPGAQEEKDRAEQERQRTDMLMRALVSVTEALERKASRDAEVAAQVFRLSTGLHERVGPAISGLSYAFLVLAGQRKLAETQRKAEEKRGYPPMQAFEVNGEDKK